ncbi:MAG: phenylalanine--tRNA ligase beta subunit-related protein [Pseudomonadota bacterium]
MRFEYSPFIQTNFPALSTCIIELSGVGPDFDSSAPVAKFTEMALKRLELENEGAFVEIQAWRRAYAKMGLKPTQYRCAAEALLRRLRKRGDLPKLHPLIDLCNAVSVAFAVPVAVFDMDRISGDLCVRPAEGDETYLAFSGQSETPDPGEVIFADYGRNAHARRWANRQSLRSAVSPKTTRALIVAEAQHEDAADQMLVLKDALTITIAEAFGVIATGRLLGGSDDAFVSSKLIGDSNVD